MKVSGWTGMVAVLIITACAMPPEKSADIIIYDTRVWTGNPDHQWAEGVAIKGDTIMAVGKKREVLRLRTGETKLITGRGHLVVPGFNDAHLHFVEGGFQLSSVDLRHTNNQEVFTAAIAEYAQKLPAGEWITGGDWDHTLWGGTLPTRDWIDSVTPENPVWIERLDGHMALANTVALEAAGVTDDITDIDGGTIVRNDDGTLTGVFKDNALWLVNKAVPGTSELQEDEALKAAMAYVNAQGVTSVQHMGGWGDLQVFRRAHARNALDVRISAAVPLSTWDRLATEVEQAGFGDEWLKTGALKGYVDGSLGSHTALFLEPYTDQPDDMGLQVNPGEDLYDWIKSADQAGLQAVVHAIGDSANRLLLDIIEQVDLENGSRDRRFRSEHAQHLHPDDIPRFAALGVIPSMQPYHCIDDGRWAEPLIGSRRCETTYAFRDLLDSGSRPAFGSDWSVAPATPLEGIYGAVTRRTLDGKNPEGWYPRQKISVVEAMSAYTRDAAFASFEEDIKGTLEAGKLADLVVLDRDITTIDPNTIPETRVLLTITGGRIVYQAERK